MLPPTCLNLLNLADYHFVLLDLLFIMDFLVVEFPVSTEAALHEETRTLLPERGSQLPEQLPQPVDDEGEVEDQNHREEEPPLSIAKRV